MPGAGPYIPQPVTPQIPLSPVELLKDLLNRDMDPTIVPAGAVVGPAENAAQQAGVASLTVGGAASIDRYSPVVNVRIQIRCLAHQLATVDLIANHIYNLLHVRHRELVTQRSSGNTYLVHRTAVLAGPSTHFDGVATWEALMFVELDVGQQPV